MKISLLSATVSTAVAFSPSVLRTANVPLYMSTESTDTVEATEVMISASETAAKEITEEAMPDQVEEIVTPLNGWIPNKSLPCYGLPGAIAPLGFFDPLGFTKDMDVMGVKRFREAEIMHGRVAMMATVGYLIGESTPTITYGMDVHHTIANNQIPEVPGAVLFPFFLFINVSEAWRASRGWVEPGLGPLFSLRDNYYPGDIGFDPLGLKPADPKAYDNMQAKELSNGRLAMIAAAGMCVQELVNGKGILENLGF